MSPDSKSKVLYLHIGTHKTASTLLRRTLLQNTDVLEREQIKLVPRHVFKESDFFAWLARLNAGKLSVEDPVPENAAQDFLQMVSGPEERVLITSEDMFRRLPLADFYQRINVGLTRMQELLPGWEIKVILYVRQQKSFVESCYTQLIQLGRDLDFADYTGGELPRHLNWAKVCDDIAGVVGKDNLKVRPFEVIKTLGTEGFVRDFLSLLDLSPEAAAAFPYAEEKTEGRAANRSFSEPGMKVARFTMPLVAKKDRAKLRRFLQENLSTEHYPRPTFFTKEETATLFDFYQAENERLFREYMLGFSAVDMGYA